MNRALKIEYSTVIQTKFTYRLVIRLEPSLDESSLKSAADLGDLVLDVAVGVLDLVLLAIGVTVFFSSSSLFWPRLD